MAIQGTTHIFIQKIDAINERGLQSALELERTKRLMEIICEQIDTFQREKVNLHTQRFREKIPEFQTIEKNLLAMQKELEDFQELFKTHRAFLDLLKENNSDDNPFPYLVTVDFLDSRFENEYKIAQIELATLVDTFRDRIPRFQASLKNTFESTASYRLPHPLDLNDKIPHPPEWGRVMGKWAEVIMQFEETKRKSEIYTKNAQTCHQLNLTTYRIRAKEVADDELRKLNELETQLPEQKNFPEMTPEQALIIEILKKTAQNRYKPSLTSFKAFCNFLDNPGSFVQTYLPANFLKEFQKLTSWLGLT